MHCEVFSKGCLLTYFRMCMYKSNNILFSSVSHIFFFICSTNNHNPYIFISHFLSFFIIFFSYFPHLLTFPFAFPHAKKTQRTNLFIIRAHITKELVSFPHFHSDFFWLGWQSVPTHRGGQKGCSVKHFTWWRSLWVTNLTSQRSKIRRDWRRIWSFWLPCPNFVTLPFS